MTGNGFKYNLNTEKSIAQSFLISFFAADFTCLCWFLLFKVKKLSGSLTWKGRFENRKADKPKIPKCIVWQRIAQS